MVEALHCVVGKAAPFGTKSALHSRHWRETSRVTGSGGQI